MENNRGSSMRRHVSKSTTALPEIIKSPVDKRNYRAFKLENDLTVIAISDPGTSKAAAALNVLVGSLCDPVEIPGLAHYLEHMLFLGTEKYPEENGYAKYLAENAGSTNAFTYGDNTSYYFDCSPDALEGALDRFAQFFISPLFTNSGSEREVNAVNSEHEGNIADDECRKHAIDSYLSNLAHPYAGFGSGNKYTLRTRPSLLGIDMRDALISFYDEYYSANLMKLVVIGKETCEELQGMVERYFLGLENCEYVVPMWPVSPYGAGELSTRLDILPVMDIRVMTLTFPILDYSRHYKTGVLTYVKSLLGHEGPGSVLSLLKKKNWATSLACSTETPGRGFSFLNVQIEMTALGLEALEDVALHFFQYVELLRQAGPQRWYWDEIKTIDENTFRFLEDLTSDALVMELVEQMATCPVEDVWTSRYILSEYQPDLITEVTKRLHPTNVRVIVQTKENRKVVTETEEFYNAKYHYSKLPFNTVEKWSCCGLHEDLHLPKPNTFIPTVFGMKPREQVRNETVVTPRILVDDELSRVWFVQDNEFLLPRGIIALDILSGYPQQSPENLNLNNLLQNIVRDLIAEECYAAGISGYSYDVSHSMTGMWVSVEGYDHKLFDLFYLVLSSLLSLELPGPRFEVMKESFIRNLRNWHADEPICHSSDYMGFLTINRDFTNRERLAVISGLTPANLVFFKQKLFSSVKLQWYVIGNYTVEDALNIHNRCIGLFHELGSEPAFSEELMLRRQLMLPIDCNYVLTARQSTHTNSCVRIRLQLGIGDIRQRATMLLMEHIMSEPFFDTLRTKEQLGYVVECSYLRQVGVMYLEVAVQGERHPLYLEGRVDSFFEQMQGTFETLRTEEIQKYKDSLKVLLREKPKTLSGRLESLADEITNRTFEFDAVEKLAAEVQRVTHLDLRFFYNYWIAPSSKSRRKLVVHVISMSEAGAGTMHKQLALDESVLRSPRQEPIIDVDAWKAMHGLYPAPFPETDVPYWKTRSNRLSNSEPSSVLWIPSCPISNNEQSATAHDLPAASPHDDPDEVVEGSLEAPPEVAQELET